MLSISNYHYIREDFTSKYPSIFGVTPKEFQKQLEALAKHGEFISLADLLDFRERVFDKNYILITFDDGLKEQYELAKPILDKMGIPAVFFINTSNFTDGRVSLVHKVHLIRSQLASREILGVLQKSDVPDLSKIERERAIAHYNYDEDETAILKYVLNFKLSLKEQEDLISPLFEEIFEERKIANNLYFSNEMLQNLHTEGFLASHAHNHVPLGQLSKKDLESDLNETQDFFRNTFGKVSEAISYPYGSYEACHGISDEVRKAGFKLGFTMERASNQNLKNDPLLLSRYDCNDLPLGKNDLFKGEGIFKNPPLRKWHTYEDSITHKR